MMKKSLRGLCSGKAVSVGRRALCSFLVIIFLGSSVATDAFSDCTPLYSSGRQAEAAQCYDEVIRENGSSNGIGWAWYQKSLYLYSELGDLDGAIAAINEAARIDPQYEEFRSIFIPNEKTRVFAKANPEAIKSNNTDSNNTTALIYYGLNLYKQGMYDESLQCYSHILELDPTNAMAMFGKALVLIVKGQTSNATKVFDEIVETGFDDAYVWEDVAISLDEVHGSYGEAIRCFDRAIAVYDEYIKQNSSNVTAWNNKGVDLSLQASVDRTAYSYLTLYTDDTSISKRLKHVDYREAKWKEALECFNEATQLDPRCADAWYNKGLVLYELNNGYNDLGSYEAIVKCFDQSKSLSDDEDSCLRLEDTRDAEYQSFMKVQELKVTSRSDSWA